MRRLLAALGLAGVASALAVALLLARRRGHRRALDRLLHAAELRRTVERLQDDLAARGPGTGPPATTPQATVDLGAEATITLDPPTAIAPSRGD